MMWSRIAILGLVAVLLGTGGCGGEVVAPTMPVDVVQLDEDRWLGEPLAVENLLVWPVYTKRPLELGEFVTLEEAEAKGVARVTEVGGHHNTNEQVQVQQAQVIDVQNEVEVNDEGPGPQQGRGQEVILDGGPTVGTLVIENDGELPILVVAGTIVKGGQQDRQIAQDLVIAAHSKVPVEAFCVEPGRWNARADTDGVRFSQGGLGVAITSVRAKAQYAKDQQEVWDEVHQVLDKKGIQSTSTFVAAVEEEDGEARTRRENIEATIQRQFDALASAGPKPVGFAYAVNGDIQSVRAFAHARLLADHLPSFIQAMALEADLGRDGENKDATARDVASFVAALNEAHEDVQPTHALNTLGTRENDDGYNGRCYLPGDDAEAAERTVTVDWTRR